MDVEQFWSTIEDARLGVADLEARADEAIAARLVTRLAAAGPETTVAFHHRFSRARGSLARWDVWGAAYLIGRGCGDDSFSDFRAGVVGLGRTWYTRVLIDPDDLAGHPLVQQAAAERRRDRGPLFSEPINYAARRAYEQITGDGEAFYEAIEAVPDDPDDGPSDMGEDFDFDDNDEMRRRLPRLADLFLGGPTPR